MTTIQSRKMLIDGELVEASGGATLRAGTRRPSRSSAPFPRPRPRTSTAPSGAAREGRPRLARPHLDPARGGRSASTPRSLEDNLEELAHLDAIDSGNPITSMRADVQGAIGEIRYFAGHRRRDEGPHHPQRPGRADLHRVRALPGGRADRAVQPPDQVRLGQVRRPAGRRLPRHRQARRADLAVGAAPRRAGQGPLPGRRLQRDHRQRRHRRRRARRAPAGAPGRLHRQRRRPASASPRSATSRSST